MSVAIRRALYGKMAGDTTLTNQLGTPAPGYSKSIYYQFAPTGAGFPYVIFNKSSGTPTYTFQTGHAAIDDEMWLIKAVDRNTSADPADSISSRLDALLTDGTLSISGKSQMYLRRESDVEYPEDDNGEQFTHAGALYRLIYQ